MNGEKMLNQIITIEDGNEYEIFDALQDNCYLVKSRQDGTVCTIKASQIRSIKSMWDINGVGVGMVEDYIPRRRFRSEYDKPLAMLTIGQRIIEQLTKIFSDARQEERDAFDNEEEN